MPAIRPLPFASKIVIAALVAAAGGLHAAEPLASATVTRVENRVSYGKVIGEKSEMRPAAPEDVVKAENFLMSETESRAELKYDDGTIVRIGQNTIFSFEANTRTLNLKKGTFVFYMPKGKGGGTIKTPSLTAAITGTVGKVSDNFIAIIEGEITLVPSGRKVSEGFFARMNADGTIDILPFDLSTAFNGKLMSFNGPLPGVPSATTYDAMLAAFQALGIQGTFDRVNNLPSGVLQFTGTEGPSTKHHHPVDTTPRPTTPVPVTPTPTPTRTIPPRNQLPP